MLRLGFAALAVLYIAACAGAPWWLIAAPAAIAAIAGARSADDHLD